MRESQKTIKEVLKQNPGDFEDTPLYEIYFGGEEGYTFQTIYRRNTRWLSIGYPISDDSQDEVIQILITALEESMVLEGAGNPS